MRSLKLSVKKRQNPRWINEIVRASWNPGWRFRLLSSMARGTDRTEDHLWLMVIRAVKPTTQRRWRDL